MASQYQIGTNHGTLDTLDNLGLPDPFPCEFEPVAKTYVDGTGRPTGDGFATAVWSFDILTLAQFDTMMSFIDVGVGDDIAIVTRIDEGSTYAGEFTEFYGFIQRPVQGKDFKYALGRRYVRDVEFTFVSLQEYTP